MTHLLSQVNTTYICWFCKCCPSAIQC